MARLRIAARLLALIVLLLLCVPPCLLWRAAGWKDPWPRRFLAGARRLLGVALRIEGAMAPGRVLLLANHVSWLDIPILAAASGTAFVGHDGLASMPLLKWLCMLNDTVFVARHQRRSVGTQIASMRAALEEMGALAVFPEGTTSDGTGLLPFKSSLLAALDPLPAGLAVQPVWLDYGRDCPQIAWTGDEPGLVNFLHILARREKLRVTVHFLAPLRAKALTDRKAMARAAREAIGGEMGKAKKEGYEG